MASGSWAGITATLHDGDELRVGRTTFVMLARASGLRDAALTDRKVGGAIGGENTVALEAPDWRAQVAAELLKAGGDVEKAAAGMGMPRDAFERMIEAANQE